MRLVSSPMVVLLQEIVIGDNLVKTTKMCTSRSKRQMLDSCFFELLVGKVEETAVDRCRLVVFLTQNAREEAESLSSWLHNSAACPFDPAAVSAAVVVRIVDVVAVADNYIAVDASSRAGECVVLHEMVAQVGRSVLVAVAVAHLLTSANLETKWMRLRG